MRVHLVGLAACVAMVLATGVAVAGEDPADVCLEVTPGSVAPEDWDAVAAAVSESVAERSALFPSPQVDSLPSRLDIDSGHPREERRHGPCLESGFEWTAHFGRDFIAAGADQLLAEAPKTPGFSSEGTIEWYPAESRLRTRLDFSGPFGIPNGRCWVDDVLAVDPVRESVVASGERGLDTSPLGDVVCDRFYGYLPDGGAGEQAVTLLPTTVALADGSVLRFVAQSVLVAEEAISVSGRLERD